MSKKSTSAGRRRSAAPTGDLDAVLEEFKDFPALEVLSRRFINPNDPGSQPILLKDESPNVCVNSDHMNKLQAGDTACRICGKPARIWIVRWFNLTIDGRNAQMKAKGYVPVRIAELPDANDISDLYRSKDDEHVRRGDHGREILAKMPLKAFLIIKERQREHWNKTAISPKKVKESLAEAAGAELGDEAGQMIHDGAIQVESMTKSSSTLGEEAGLSQE
jgi:hypothetical protein